MFHFLYGQPTCCVRHHVLRVWGPTESSIQIKMEVQDDQYHSGDTDVVYDNRVDCMFTGSCQTGRGCELDNVAERASYLRL